MQPRPRRDYPAKIVYPVMQEEFVSSFGVPKVSQGAGVWEHKNNMGRGGTIMNEWIEGLILNLTGVVGTFQIGEQVRGSVTNFSGEVVGINGDALRIKTEFQDWNTATPDVITGQTSTATGNLSSISGAGITYNTNESTVSLSVTGTAGDRVIRESSRPLAYVSGKGQVFKGTGVFASGELSIVRRDSTSGAVKTKSYLQSQFSEDTVDGTNGVGNPSEKNIDVTLRNIYWLDLEWLAAGLTRFGNDFSGFPQINHRAEHANSAVTYDDDTSDNGNRPYMATASLPVRYEIYNDGVNVYQRLGYFNDSDGLFYQVKTPNANAATMKEFCHAVESDGGYILPGLEFSTKVAGAGQSITARTPILGIRLKPTLSGKDNRKIVRFLKTSYFAKSNDTFFEFAHVHHPLDVTGNWTEVSDSSGVEYSTDLTFTPRPEHVVETEDMDAAGGARGGASASVTSEAINQHSFIARDIFNLDSQLFVVYATPHTGTAIVKANMSWIEFA
jgi:hypothetical protein